MPDPQQPMWTAAQVRKTQPEGNWEANRRPIWRRERPKLWCRPGTEVPAQFHVELNYVHSKWCSMHLVWNLIILEGGGDSM